MLEETLEAGGVQPLNRRYEPHAESRLRLEFLLHRIIERLVGARRCAVGDATVLTTAACPKVVRALGMLPSSKTGREGAVEIVCRVVVR
jgi:hypothetical protein